MLSDRQMRRQINAAVVKQLAEIQETEIESTHRATFQRVGCRIPLNAKRIGGHSIKDSTERVRRTIRSDELALTFNWVGVKRSELPKEAFINFKLVDVVWGAVFKMHNTSTKQLVKDVIKAWLKYAKCKEKTSTCAKTYKYTRQTRHLRHNVFRGVHCIGEIV